LQWLQGFCFLRHSAAFYFKSLLGPC
jgi:hypothetical protein